LLHILHSPWKRKKQLKYEIKLYEDLSPNKSTICLFKHCSGKIGSSCSTSGIRRVNLVTNPFITHEWGKDREVLTTSGTYLWSFVFGREKKYKRTYNEIQNIPGTHKSKYRVIRTSLKTNEQRYVPLVANTSRSCPHSWVITGFVTRLTRRVPLVEQEMSTLPEHLSSPPDFSGVPVIRSLVLWVCTHGYRSNNLRVMVNLSAMQL
jgi:hypothetical protein